MQAQYLLKDLYIHFKPEVQTEQQMQLKSIAFDYTVEETTSIITKDQRKITDNRYVCVQAPQGRSFPSSSREHLILKKKINSILFLCSLYRPLVFKRR